MIDHLESPDWYFNLKSGPQMQEFLYEFLGVEPLSAKNDKGNYSVDESTLNYYAEHQNITFCQLILNYRKLLKAKNTYLSGIVNNISELDFMLHAEFWLNLAETYRSSSSDPNFQNIPKHGDLIPGLPWKTIRRMFVSLSYIEINQDPRFLLGETDYVGAETKVAGMLSDDPQMIDDLNNDVDMHSHWAIILFGLKGMSYDDVKNQYNDSYRFLAKNNFTFANIYGAGNVSIAEEMRKSEHYIEYLQSIYNTLQRRQNFHDFCIDYSEKHIADCQKVFYNRYSKFKKWQDELLNSYYETGYVENPFGFRRRYPLKRNEIINYPIQSTSFLLLLDSLIKIEEYILNETNWTTRLVGQIHDSAYSNINRYEIYDYIELVDYHMINKPDLPWTHKVKMDTDWSIGHSWYDMKSLNEYKRCN